ncbi:MAG: DMT family transporter [Abitibacteriaceae bacterium]|nr:DMT family transporter [Abditibacteriaceae bacterium]
MKILGTPRLALALGLALLLWASGFAGIRVALHAYSPGHLALLRYLVASTVLAVIAGCTHRSLPATQDIPGIALMGLLGFTIYNIALNYGELSVAAGAASFLVNTAPVFTVLLAISFLRERVTAWGWVGIAISFVGVTIIALGEGKGFSFSPHAWLILLAALSTSCYTILQKHYLKTYRPLPLTTYVIWAGTIGMSVFLPGLAQQVRVAPPQMTLVVVYMGIFPAAFAYVLWTYVLSKIPASIAVSFLYMVPVFATLIAWVWLKEIPSAMSLIGGAIALMGVVLVNTRGR